MEPLKDFPRSEYWRLMCPVSQQHLGPSQFDPENYRRMHQGFVVAAKFAKEKKITFSMFNELFTAVCREEKTPSEVELNNFYNKIKNLDPYQNRYEIIFAIGQLADLPDYQTPPRNLFVVVLQQLLLLQNLKTVMFPAELKIKHAELKAGSQINFGVRKFTEFSIESARRIISNYTLTKHISENSERLQRALSKNPLIAMAQLNELFIQVQMNNISVPKGYWTINAFNSKYDDELHQAMLEELRKLYLRQFKLLIAYRPEEDEKNIPDRTALQDLVKGHALARVINEKQPLLFEKLLDAPFTGLVYENYSGLATKLLENAANITEIELDERINVSELCRLLIALKDNTRVKKLSVRVEYNQLDRDAAYALVQLITHNKTLTHIDLNDAWLPTSNSSDFMTAVENNNRLLTLNVGIDGSSILNTEKLRLKRNLFLKRNLNEPRVLPEIALCMFDFIAEAVKFEGNPPALIEKLKTSPVNDVFTRAMKGDPSVSFKMVTDCLQDVSKEFKQELARTELENAKWFIKYVMDVAIEADFGLIHLIASWGVTSLLPTLVNDFKRDVNVGDKHGHTPLHHAALQGRLDMVKELLMEKYHVKIDSLSKDKFSALMLAQKNGQDHIVEEMQNKYKEKSLPITELEAKKWTQKRIAANRRLYYVLGGKKLSEEAKKLSNNAETKGTHSHAEGGSEYEALTTLALYFERFIQQKTIKDRPDVYEILNKILGVINKAIKLLDESLRQITKPTLVEHVRQRRKQDQMFAMAAKEMKSGETQLLCTGCLGHLTGACLKREGADYTLTIADRGYFVKRFTQTESFSERYFCAKSINFSEDKLNDVIDALLKARELNATEAQELLFTTMEDIAKSKYVDEPNIVKSAFKVGICFFANIKPIIQKLLLDEFKDNTKLANKLYKEFFTFAREQALEDYRQANESKEHLAAATTIVGKRRAKYPSMFEESKTEKLESTEPTNPPKTSP